MQIGPVQLEAAGPGLQQLRHGEAVEQTNIAGPLAQYKVVIIDKRYDLERRIREALVEMLKTAPKARKRRVRWL